MQYHSDELDQIVPAILQIQEKYQANPELEIRVLLKEHAIVPQIFVETEDESEITYLRLLHTSGQYVQTSLPGNSSDVIKRIVTIPLFMLIGILPAPSSPPPVKIIAEVPSEKISNVGYDVLIYELQGHPEILQSMLNFYKIQSLMELPQDQYFVALDKIRKLKKTHEDFTRRS